MDELLNCMTSGSMVFVNDFSGWGKEAEIPNFPFEKGGMEENAIIATNGEKLMLQSETIRRGNHLTVSLRKNGEEIKKANLGDFFPGQDVVITTSGESLRSFAPVCRSKMELVRFLTQIDDFCKAHEGEIHNGLQEKIEKLALWFYKNNPEKAQEGKWDI